MVAKKVEVVTQSWQEGAEAVRWTCEGDPAYTLEEASRDSVGTDVILHVTDEEKDFLEESTIASLLDKYCKFLSVPIQFGMKEVPVVKEGEEAEEADEEPEMQEVPNIVNNTDPLWKKVPQDLKDEDYLDFYDELYPFSDQPLFWIHLKDRKSTRLNSSHVAISYAVFCLKKKSMIE